MHARAHTFGHDKNVVSIKIRTSSLSFAPFHQLSHQLHGYSFQVPSCMYDYMDIVFKFRVACMHAFNKGDKREK